MDRMVLVQHELRSEGGSGSSSSAPMADMDDDEDSTEAWKQGDATKQVNYLASVFSLVFLQVVLSVQSLHQCQMPITDGDCCLVEDFLAWRAWTNGGCQVLLFVLWMLV